jgi:hypothetical protein
MRILDLISKESDRYKVVHTALFEQRRNQTIEMLRSVNIIAGWLEGADVTHIPLDEREFQFLLTSFQATNWTAKHHKEILETIDYLESLQPQKPQLIK